MDSVVGAIETKRLRLEPIIDGRWLEHFVRLLADPVTTRFLWNGEPQPRDFAEQRYRFYVEHWQKHGFGHRALIDKATGTWVGKIGVHYTGPEAPEVPLGTPDIGWFVIPEAMGRGFATEAALAAREEAFDRVGLDCLVARIQPANTASVRVAEKLGMQQKRLDRGAHGEVVAIYQIDR